MTKRDKKIIILNEVESTNNYASQLVLSNAADEETVVLTQFQTRGRGQAGNHWESEAGKNLLASIIFYPGFLNAVKQFAISKVVSLGLVDFLEREIDDVAIKWPNDIYVENRKIAGILIENMVKGDSLTSSVVGIGLNLNQKKFLSDAPNPVSLKQITGENYDVKIVASEIHEAIFKWYEKIKLGSFSEIDSAYFSKLYGAGEWRKFIKNDKTFNARIIGVGKFGQLRLENRNGIVDEFMFKEVEFVL